MRKQPKILCFYTSDTGIVYFIQSVVTTVTGDGSDYCDGGDGSDYCDGDGSDYCDW